MRNLAEAFNLAFNLRLVARAFSACLITCKPV